ncbi:MAG: NUDIX hydrolase, partial [Pseudolabrys sp.]
VLVRQYRAGVERVTLEIPGGSVEPHESPLQAAARELREETGYSSQRWQPLGVVEPNPALQTNRCYNYLACRATRTEPRALDETECMATEEVALASIDELLRDGSITHALVQCALLQLYRCAGGWRAPTP